MKYKKGRLKPPQEQQHSEENNGMNGNTEVPSEGEKRKERRRKSGEKYKLDQQAPDKRIKKENSKKSEVKKEQIIRSDSPGIDLRIFEPRGKRRCVIQNELKKQRDNWWSDGEEEEGDDEEEEEEEGDGGEEGEEEEEIEEEIIDDDDDDEEDEQEIEVKEEDIKEEEVKNEKVVEEKREEITVVKPKRKRATKTNNEPPKKTTKQPSVTNVTNGITDPNSLETTRRFFVFSTAMANRAGHSVSKGLHTTISKYHDAQQWDTPYLRAEVHCRPFVANLEDSIVKQQLEEKENLKLLTKVKNEGDLKDNVKGVVSPERVEPSSVIPTTSTITTTAAPATTTITSDDVKPVVNKERTLSVDSWQKEQVIQAAQRMNRTVNQQQPSPLDENSKNSPLHPRFNLFNQHPSGTPTSQQYSNGVMPLAAVVSTDSDSSPQTVPTVPKMEKLEPDHVEPDHVEQLESTNNIVKNNTMFKNYRSPPSLDDDYSRNKDLNSPPPQLVPTLPHAKDNTEQKPKDNGERVASSKSNSYPAEITNLKEQLRYQSPKNFNSHKPVITSKELDMRVRPTVISMPSDRDVTENVRSSIDIAEKALKESRFKHSPPILPRDVGSAFLPTRDSPHLRPPSFKGFSGLTPNGNALFNPRLHQLSSFSPPASHHYPHPREAIENIVDFSRNSAGVPAPPARPSVTRTNDYSDTKTFSENYKPLSSSFSSVSHRKDRPSSLPVAEIYGRPDHKLPPRNPFSVETLTQSHVKRNDRIPDENTVVAAHHLDRRFTQASQHHRFHERVIPGSHPHERTAHERVGHERVHIPNGMNIHNGLKRTLDEQLSNNIRERVEHERKYLDHLHDDWRRQEKDRMMAAEKERLLDKDRMMIDKERMMIDKERLIHATRAPFAGDPRSPLHIPAYLPRANLPNGSHHSDLPSPSHHPLYSNLRRIQPYTSGPYPHG